MDRSRARVLARDAIARGEALAWFEALYREADAGTAVVPWADLVPNPHLVNWLDAHPTIGGRALDVGTGFGDNAEELARRGLAVVAFDVAATTSLPVGSANLLTGNYQISAGDVSVPGNQGEALSVGRTFNTALATTAGANGAPTSGIFGPGWTSSLPVDSAGADWAALSDTGSVLTAIIARHRR